MGPVLGLGIDEGGVDARGHALGELGHDLGVQRIVEGRDHDPVLPVGRAFPGEHHDLACLIGHDVVDQPGIGLDRIHDPRIGGIGYVDGVEPVAAERGADVGDLAVRVDPDFGGRQGLPDHRAHDLGAPVHLAPSHRHRRAGGASGQRRGHAVGPGVVGDEGAVAPDLAPARGEGPRRAHALDGPPTRVLRHQPEADHLALLHPGVAGLDGERGRRGGRDGDGGRGPDPAGRRGQGGSPRPARLEQAAPGHARGAGRGAGPADAVVGSHVALRRVHPRGERHPLAGHQPLGVGGDLDALCRARPDLEDDSLHHGLGSGHERGGDDEYVAHAAGADQAGGIDPGGGEARLVEEDRGVGDRPAGAIEGASGELQRVADGELRRAGVISSRVDGLALSGCWAATGDRVARESSRAVELTRNTVMGSGRLGVGVKVELPRGHCRAPRPA